MNQNKKQYIFCFTFKVWTKTENGIVIATVSINKGSLASRGIILAIDERAIVTIWWNRRSRSRVRSIETDLFCRK